MSGPNLSHPATKISHKSKRRALLIFLIALWIIPIVGLGFKVSIQPPHYAQKSVWASLYTWYGAPGYPAGKAFLPQYDGSAGNWSLSSSTMMNVQPIAGSNRAEFEGIANGNQNSLVLNASTAKYFSNTTRVYLAINISASKPHLGDIYLEIHTQYQNYSSVILNASHNPNQYYMIYRVFPFQFMNGTYIGNPMIHEIIIRQTAINDGLYQIRIGSLELSNWKHYNEDYHTIESTEKPGFWYNDPPVLLATAHRVFYNQSIGPWPEVETYGFYDHGKWNEVPLNESQQFGIYDSLDPVVIRSQLRLMERAGINVVQIMHPWNLGVVSTIFDIALAINSNLSFFLYGSMDPTYVGQLYSKFMTNPQYRDLWYHIDNRPVYNFGYTAEPNTIPYASLRAQIKAIRANYSIYLIGDGFSSPYLFNEEFLEGDSFDGWYYYDTSAFYRHGWGDPAVKNYQSDGTLYPFNAWNQLDRVFGQIATVAHAKGKTYCAIIIPGTDNTCVHDFKGTPLYDGRTGTINERAGGLTFNRTWEAAIESGADYACIVSWNELHEGTEIEPTIENGTYYVESCAYWANRFRNL